MGGKESSGGGGGGEGGGMNSGANRSERIGSSETKDPRFVACDSSHSETNVGPLHSSHDSK